MNPIIRNILSVLAGWLLGSIINMSLVNAGHMVFPLAGVDPSDMEALAAAMPSMEARHFLFPFLAHALGTLSGAAVAAVVAASHKMKFALGIGGLFLIGGIMVNYMLPGPVWFAVIDIVLAYLPMGWLGGKTGLALTGK
jgi:hypothetical protein